MLLSSCDVQTSIFSFLCLPLHPLPSPPLQVMGDVLALEDLVESQDRDRLPSPQELQGKILLKGSYGKVSLCVAPPVASSYCTANM